MYKTLAERQSAILTSPNDVSAKLEYLENQSRRSNKIKVKKLFTDCLKIDPKVIEIERAHCHCRLCGNAYRNDILHTEALQSNSFRTMHTHASMDTYTYAHM